MNKQLGRIVEAGVAAATLIALSPALAAVAALIRALTGPPVLFRQRRAGLHGRAFTLYKFRTMSGELDSDGNLLPDAERLTRLGRCLRATSLDELPQLWNVLIGKMRLVGPRPLFADYLPLYTPFQRRRLEVKPGLTGWAQIRGRNALSWEEKFSLDVWYVDHASFWLDCRILAETVWQVLARRGTSHPGQATMPRFMGSAAPGPVSEWEPGCERS